MTKNIFRRILSIASALAIVFTAYPPVIFADDGGLCPHHPEHTAECGYVEGESPCNFVCEICNPPEVSDSPEPSDEPMPEVTTSPEEQPPVTTAPEPEPVETVTTETMPEESETMPTEPEVQLMALEAEPHNHVEDGIVWTAWERADSLPDSAGNWYLTQPVTLTSGWSVSGDVKLCLNGQAVNCGENQVKVENGASLTVYDCQNGSGITGGGNNTVMVEYGGSFTLKSGNIVNDGASGIAINANGYNGYDGANMTHVTINDGTVESLSQGIVAAESTVTVTDGVIKGGSNFEQAYGIFSYGGLLNISGGTITSNDTYAVSTTSSTFNLSGKPTIKGAKGDIYVYNHININNPLSGGPFSVEKGSTGEFATGTYAAQSVNCFKSADPTKYMVQVTAAGNALEIVERPEHKHDDDPSTVFQPWVRGDSLPTTEGNYYLTEDVTLTGEWEPRCDVKLCLNGYDIICGDNQIKIGYNGSLSVYDCVGEGEISRNNGTTIYASNGSFALYGGKIISYGANGYALNIGISAAIYGGELTSQDYDAIFVMNDSYLTVSGGIISGKRYAIDITSCTYGEFTLSGNPKLEGQTADIYTDYTGTMTISGLDTSEVYTVWYRSSSGTLATVDSGNAKDYVKNFTSVDDRYDVVSEEDSLKLVEKHKHDDITFDRWYDAANLPVAAGNYCLETDVTLNDWRANWNVPGDVKLCLNGHNIKFANMNYAEVRNGSSLTIYDCKSGGEITGNSECTINVDGGEFTLESGKISFTGSSGYGISVKEGGSVTINGGRRRSERRSN